MCEVSEEIEKLCNDYNDNIISNIEFLSETDKYFGFPHIDGNTEIWGEVIPDDMDSERLVYLRLSAKVLAANRSEYGDFEGEIREYNRSKNLGNLLD